MTEFSWGSDSGDEKAGAKIYEKDKNYHDTALHLASKKGMLEVVKYILERDNSGVNSQNIFKQSPLHEG